jgi:Protein of unknown function (DUF1552)
VTASRASWPVSRRRFLGGGAVAIGLPAFESLLGKAYAQTVASRKRVVTVFSPNGQYYKDWLPAQVGPLDQLPPHLQPFAPVKSKFSVLSNLANLSGRPRGGGGDHAAGTGAAFNCVQVSKADGAGISAGITVDQVAAGHLKQFTRIPSLQLGVLPGRETSVCEAGYGCVYENTISWAGPKQPLAPVRDPLLVFNQIFAGFDPGETEAARAERVARRKSVLDYVREEARWLAGRLGRSDAHKLDQLASSVGDIEKKLQQSGAGQCGIARPASPGEDYDARGKLLNDVIVAAFQCDVTRVVSHMLAPPYPNIAYNFIQAPGGHHTCSHWHNPQEEVYYRAICAWHNRQVADLLGKLDRVPEDGGTLLDNSFVVLTSDCGYSRTHDHANLPVLVGGGAGLFKTGRHVMFPKGTPLANLFISILNAVGVPATSFGSDGRGPLSMV